MTDQTNQATQTGAAQVTSVAQPATVVPVIAPGDRLTASLPGDTIAAKIDALHAKHFLGTEIAAATTLWNKVMAFKEDVKKLIAEVEADIAKL